MPMQSWEEQNVMDADCYSYRLQVVLALELTAHVPSETR
jgi:hypothetical protein